MVALLMLYPGLSAVKLVGTDLVQAVPLVLAAAISNIVVNNGLDWGLLIPLVIGSVPGTILGSTLAPRVPQSFIRRGIVVVLTMSGVALLDKAGWAPLGVEETHPLLIGGIGIAMIVLVPLIWGLLRKEQGLPMFGAPTVAELEDPSFARDRRAHPRRHRLTGALCTSLDNPIRDYAWGSRTALAAFLDREPSGEPEAELWVGAHAATPSRLPDGRRLDDEIGARPGPMLGPDVAERFGDRLPFLMKVLAVDQVLSLQVHPRQRAGAARPCS